MKVNLQSQLTFLGSCNSVQLYFHTLTAKAINKRLMVQLNSKLHAYSKIPATSAIDMIIMTEPLRIKNDLMTYKIEFDLFIVLDVEVY